MKWSQYLMLFALVAAILPAAKARAEIIDGVAAVANGDVIALSEVEERAGPGLPGSESIGVNRDRRDSMLKHAAEDLVTEKLVGKECKEENLEPTSAELDNAIEDVEHANHIDRPTLEKALGEQGLDIPHYREMLTSQLCRMKVVEMKVKNRVTVSEDDVKNALANRGGSIGHMQEMRIRDIYIPFGASIDEARAKVRAARERLVGGADFADVAREAGGPLASTGGNLGWMKETDLAPELLRAVARLTVGGISGIVETKAGFHLLKLDERRASTDVKAVQEIKDEIRKELMTERMEKATADYLAELKRGAELDVRLP